ncbi:MAG: hypothetical protein HY370_02080 [Proteobacteria bacterium]|nr:hypothetical protein [Pseudomonadota bacterium]
MTRKYHTERGSALIYILIAIALLALLTVVFMEPSSQQTQTQNTFRLVSELQSQTEFIRSSVQECVIKYFKGDKNIQNGIAQEDEGANKRYPVKPNSAYLTGPAGNRNVGGIRCPGNPGNSANHAAIFAAGQGKFLPPAPALFGEWQWYNGNDGVFFWIATDKSDAFIRTALTKLDESFAECEADVIDTADAPAGAKDLDSDTTLTCPANNVCFRVWMIANTATNVYNGDADGDEAGCP